MSIIYIIVKTLTLPGAMLHSFFEHMSCRASKVLVDDARAIQFNEMLGHIDHELIKRKGPSFDVCFIPFFFNLVLGFLTLTIYILKLRHGYYKAFFLTLHLYVPYNQ